MPHVRAQEYKKPSKDYQLEYVEVVQRHHKVGPVTKLKEPFTDISEPPTHPTLSSRRISR